MDLLENYQSGLRAGDALHLAIVKEMEKVRLLTLDRKLISIAQAAGISAGLGFDED
ncbi:MAG: hypothetical protein K5872_23375 [Rhizobiaceae bacterium]|nr:hypothetical protein [Rhizobiaceae bacterium]MCV0409163.1 hypothetical protein [Rhizobiaceae bacterium]